MGTTKDEGIIWLIDPLKNNSLFEKMQREWDTMWGPLLVGLHDLDEVTDVDLYKSYKLLAFYIGGLENLNENHLQGVFDMYTDSAMLYGVNRSQDTQQVFWYKNQFETNRRPKIPLKYIFNQHLQYSFFAGVRSWSMELYLRISFLSFLSPFFVE